ncbi:Fibroblast growth factor receptor 2 [Mizuhopecten yessoensis]|uniref:Fibroblast growth factor receptor 2 n=1 Tax=Mizuhopecten yessoensis TaxID=6573 RepID=A0A210R3Z4_MIZYE|nr:Fibroblast growth factor receptor 2 [Mizuhopecten yessoensis]
MVATVSTKSGGFRGIRSLDTLSHYRNDFYETQTATKHMQFMFDYHPPYHCMETKTCSRQPLLIRNDISKNVSSVLDDHEGKRTLKKIANKNGITKVQITHNLKGHGGLRPWTNVAGFLDEKATLNISRLDGETIQISVKAFDVMGNSCFYYLHQFAINNCWLMVPKDKLETQVIDIHIDVFNLAMLNATVHMVARHYCTETIYLICINSDYGPMDLVVSGKTSSSANFQWHQGPSCYDRTDILLMYNVSGQSRTMHVHKDSEYYTLGNLDPETTYTAQFVVEYGDEKSDPVKITFTTAGTLFCSVGPFMLLELCETGVMRTWLQNHRTNVTDSVVDTLYRMTFDIAKGMDFLASKQIIHRHLAARNILLTSSLEAKVAGFGPTKESEQQDADTGREKVPIKWMAPECMTSLKDATMQSDVWSYAIVIWEIFSLGDTPYPGIRSMDVATKVTNGYRMSRPEYCADMHYELMKKCWQDNQSSRPKFSAIVQEISSTFSSSQGDYYYYAAQ